MTVLRLTTSDGVSLAADMEVPENPRSAAVLLHPHPLMGGDMQAPVPAHLGDILPAEGIAVLRFEFRGAGDSDGDHDGGQSEAQDVIAAVEKLHAETSLPIWLVGWSFGADVSLQVTDEAVAGWVCITPPLQVVPPEQMAAAQDPRPKRMLVAEHDQFTSPEAVAERVHGWVNTEIQTIPGTDHFLAGRLGAVALSTTAIIQ